MQEKKNNSLNKAFIPQRTCIACRKKSSKGDFLRIVKTPEGNFVFDKEGKLDGRGAYICNCAQCINKLRKNKLLNKTFKCEVKESVYSALEEAFVGKQEQN